MKAERDYVSQVIFFLLLFCWWEGGKGVQLLLFPQTCDNAHF